MTSIGFRCWADRVSFVVVSGTIDAPRLESSDHRKAPPRVSRAEQLHWLQREIHEILDALPGVSRGFFRLVEPNAQTKDRARAEFEGVLQFSAFTHARRLEVEPRILAQVRRDLQQEQPARYLTDLVARRLPDANTTNLRDAALVSLCGLESC